MFPHVALLGKTADIVRGGGRNVVEHSDSPENLDNRLYRDVAQRNPHIREKHFPNRQLYAQIQYMTKMLYAGMHNFDMKPLSSYQVSLLNSELDNLGLCAKTDLRMVTKLAILCEAIQTTEQEIATSSETDSSLSEKLSIHASLQHQYIVLSEEYTDLQKDISEILEHSNEGTSSLLNVALRENVFSPEVVSSFKIGLCTLPVTPILNLPSYQYFEATGKTSPPESQHSPSMDLAPPPSYEETIQNDRREEQ